jgi:hypothetical protein
MKRRDSDFCPACDKLWEECKCPRLVQLGGGIVPAEPDPWKEDLNDHRHP